MMCWAPESRIKSPEVAMPTTLAFPTDIRYYVLCPVYVSRKPGSGTPVILGLISTCKGNTWGRHNRHTGTMQARADRQP